MRLTKKFLKKIFHLTVYEQWQLDEKIERAYRSSSYYVPYVDFQDDAREPDIKCLAFYLPQFHTFPENEKFWGRGFTEWTNVTRAVPLFEGHDQPHLPDELGFYDLRSSEVLKQQIERAKNYGIYGFCFHYYWFCGTPVMKVPLDHLLANPELDIPFCLHWANESWTRRWDGVEGPDMLLEQKHTPEDDIAFIKEIEPALKDKRYITIQGRPLLLIYRPGLFPKIQETIQRWNEYCRARGMPTLYLAVVHTPFDGNVDPREYGFDAAVEYPPHNLDLPNIKDKVGVSSSEFKGTIQEYSRVVEGRLAQQCPPYTLFRGLVPSFDCSARRKDPIVYFGSSPRLYKKWLAGLMRYTRQHHPSDRRFIFINAWNEWAEGAYLEPDRKYGYAYLHATRETLREEKSLTIAVVAHIYHEELADEFLQYVKNIPLPFDLYITTTAAAKEKLQSFFSQKLGDTVVHVRSGENRGKDIAPFVIEFKEIYEKYDLVCRIHTKKKKYGEDFCAWRKYLLNNLLGSAEITDTIISLFKQDRTLGIVFPEYIPAVHTILGWAKNYPSAEKLAQRLDITIDATRSFDFPAGGMFWFRPWALRPLFDLRLTYHDFEDKSEKKRDGTLAHAIERLLVIIAEKEGYHSKKVMFESWHRTVRREHEPEKHTVRFLT